MCESFCVCNIIDCDEIKLLFTERASEKISTDSVLITQGEKGMTLFQGDGEIYRFDAMARNAYDVTGAGDTVIATLAVAIGAGLNFFEAAKIANIAAGLVVEQIGTTAISLEMLETLLTEKDS